jgi:hypothetical protein
MIGVVIVFSFVLYLLFPKQDIEHIIETKGKNTNLSINYLESMLLYYPDNLKLEMILLQNYDYENKRKKAFKLINKIGSQTKDKNILDKIYQIEYRLLKEEYFNKKDKQLLAKIRQKLYNLFKFRGKDRDYVFFLAEATQMNFKKLKYLSLKGLMKQKPELINYQLEKEAFFLASYLKYKDEAQNFLINLTKYPEIDQDLKDNALSILLNHKEYDKAISLATKLFQNAKDNITKENYFNIALYATALAHSKDNNKTALNELINIYKYSVILDTHNISFILDNLLKIGDTKGASSFAQESFDIYSERFDENCTNLAIKGMIYNQDLASALTLALFAEDKFNSNKWLDKAIELSVWQGKMKYAIELNIKGYRKYKNIKYEKYLLDKTTLNNGYKILGEIYKEKVKNGDYSFIDKVAEYFDYTAKTSQGEEYFVKLLKKHKSREILKQAISFSYKNNSYKKGLKLYYKYKSKYGIDKNLQQSSINKLMALKKFHKAYILTQELETKEKHDKKLIALMKKLKIEDKFHIYTKLMNLGWIYKDYDYIYKLLWKLERLGKLNEDGYSKLITLNQELKDGNKLAYLYQKTWNKTHKINYLMALLYLYMDKKDYKKFKLTRSQLSLKNKKILEKDINYHILLANYYAQTSKIKKASNSFAKALKLDPYNSTTHQAYIWFLIDNRFNKLLKKELLLLRKNPKLQKLVGFPSVVGALQFQKSDLALKWLMPLLNSSDSLEYQVVYADILQLQDREEGASKVRLKLFRRLNKMIKKSPKLLEDKAFARVYLRLVVMFVSPYERKNFYFKKFKHLFKQKDFMDMKIGWKSYIQSDTQVKYLASKYHMNLPWLQLYIAMSRGDNQAKQELLHNYKDILAFRDRVTASKDIGDRAGAYSLAFQGMEDNQRDVDLYKIYEGMINSDYPKGEFKSKYKKLSPHITDIENRVSYRWHLYKGISSQFSIHQYRYIKDNGKDFLDDKFSLFFK